MSNITLFKRNQITFNSPSVARAYDEWVRDRGVYATGYFTGKAAVRVDGDVYPFTYTHITCICMYVCMYVYTYVCMSVCLSLCLSVSLSI